MSRILRFSTVHRSANHWANNRVTFLWQTPIAPWWACSWVIPLTFYMSFILVYFYLMLNTMNISVYHFKIYFICILLSWTLKENPSLSFKWHGCCVLLTKQASGGRQKKVKETSRGQESRDTHYSCTHSLLTCSENTPDNSVLYSMFNYQNAFQC